MGLFRPQLAQRDGKNGGASRHAELQRVTVWVDGSKRSLAQAIDQLAELYGQGIGFPPRVAPNGSARVALETVINRRWAAYLESQGYAYEVIEHATGFTRVLTKVFTL